MNARYTSKLEDSTTNGPLLNRRTPNSPLAFQESFQLPPRWISILQVRKAWGDLKSRGRQPNPGRERALLFIFFLWSLFATCAELVTLRLFDWRYSLMDWKQATTYTLIVSCVHIPLGLWALSWRATMQSLGISLLLRCTTLVSMFPVPSAVGLSATLPLLDDLSLKQFLALWLSVLFNLSNWGPRFHRIVRVKWVSEYGSVPLMMALSAWLLCIYAFAAVAFFLVGYATSPPSDTFPWALFLRRFLSHLLPSFAFNYWLLPFLLSFDNFDIELLGPPRPAHLDGDPERVSEKTAALAVTSRN